MSGSLSLEAAIRTCKVDTGWANKVESDRFFNQDLMVCPIWNGVDTAGRRVSPDSFYTKRAGCNSAEDRVVVENAQRPQYMEYINLSANGIDGNIYGNLGGNKDEYGNTMAWNQVGRTNNMFNVAKDSQSCQQKWNNGTCSNNANNVTGNFGLQLSADIYPSCNYNSGNSRNYDSYEEAKNQVAREQEALRRQQALEEGYYGYNYRRSSGF